MNHTIVSLNVGRDDCRWIRGASIEPHTIADCYSNVGPLKGDQFHTIKEISRHEFLPNHVIFEYISKGCCV